VLSVQFGAVHVKGMLLVFRKARRLDILFHQIKIFSEVQHNRHYLTLIYEI